MKLNKKKSLAARLMKCSPYKVRLDEERLADVKEAITKRDISKLIKDGAVWRENDIGISRGRAKKTNHQRRKGLQRGFGSRKGSKNARNNKKTAWIARIRLLRTHLKLLRDKDAISVADYHTLYLKAKGGFFRSLKHLKLYLNEHKMLKAKEKQQ